MCYFFTFIYLFSEGRNTHTIAETWKSEDNLQELVFPILRLSSGAPNQVHGLGDPDPYPLRHFPGPNLVVFKQECGLELPAVLEYIC